MLEFIIKTEHEAVKGTKNALQTLEEEQQETAKDDGALGFSTKEFPL